MKEFILASNNKNKIIEMSAILNELGYNIKTLSESGITIEIDETGNTFEENALIKAKTILNLTNKAAIADDSGLCVDVLNGQPGIFSARFGGNGGNSDACIDKLLSQLSPYKDSELSARFVSVIAASFPDNSTIIAKGICEGKIIRQRRGVGGFGYDPIFVPNGYELTFSELPTEIKNKISHRAKALQNFKQMISK